MSYGNYSVSLGIPTMKSPSSLTAMRDNILKYIDCIDEVYFSCVPQSAAKNRNMCIDNTKSDILIMADDDIVFNIEGWATMLCEALVENKDFSIVSARPVHADGSDCPTLGDCGSPRREGKYQTCLHTEKTGLNVVGSACICFWRDCGVRFDEEYIGACYEDTDFSMSMNVAFPERHIAFVNKCNIIHNEERKGRGSSAGKRDYWRHNHDYFAEKWGVRI
jgi:GT2 family glycosyltransferase